MRVILIYLLFIFIVKEGNGAFGCDSPNGIPTETKLRKALFCDYNTHSRPVKHFDNTTQVQFKLYPTRIFMKEHSESLLFHGSILYIWKDEFLTWDPREYEGIDFIRVSSDDIWVPDVSLDLMQVYTAYYEKKGFVDCHLTYTGSVYCFIGNSFEVPCISDIRVYPYDTRVCNMSFSSSGYVGLQLNLTLINPKRGVELNLYVPNSEWELLSATAERQVRGFPTSDYDVFYPLIVCTLTLRRHSSFFSALLVVPAAVLSILTVLTFWMNKMYSMRIAIPAVTIFSDVSYCIYLAIYLPYNGRSVPVIATFFRDSILMATVSIIVTIVSQSLHTKSRQPPLWLTDFISKLESNNIVHFIFLGNPSSDDEESAEIIENPKKKYIGWSQFATFVDRISFILYCLIYFILLIFYLP